MVTESKKSTKTVSGIKEERISVLIDVKLYRDLENALGSSGFATIEEYVNYVLRIALRKKSKDSLEKTKDAEKEFEMSKEDSEKVFDRLKALGYM